MHDKWINLCEIVTGLYFLLLFLICI